MGRRYVYTYGRLMLNHANQSVLLVMRELEEEDRMIQTRNQRRRAKEAAAREAAALAAAQMQDADPNSQH
jgi:hypothetical protein